MVTPTMRTRFNPVAIEELLHSTGGMVGRDLVKRCIRVHQVAVATAPEKSGNLKRKLRWDITVGVTGLIGLVGAKDVPYFQYVIDGTRPHRIEAKDKQALYWPGAIHPVKSVNHPGTRPNDFLVRAMRSAILF